MPNMSSLDFGRAISALQKHEFDGLKLFRPTDAQATALRRMTLESTFEILIVAGNRAGKSVLAAIFFASYVRDEPITCWDGTKIYCRPKAKRGQLVNTWVIGDHLKHIGMTIYRLLFHPSPSKGLFRIIKDENTGTWRAWQPELFPSDWDRKDETRWNPPVIPERLVKEIEWAQGQKKANEFRCITLHSGTTIYGFASSGEVKQGDPVDLIWNDENIVNKEYYAEWLNRLRDDEGCMMWSTIPRDSCFVFNETINRMEEQQDEVEKGQRATTEWRCILVRLSYLDSPFIPQRQKDLALEQMGDRDTLVRIYGERSTRLISIYQDFNVTYHCAVYHDSRDDKLSEVLVRNNMVPPADWTRELILDPGTQKPFLLLGAIPPPDLWDHDEPYFVAYREIAVRRMPPHEMANEVMRTERNFRFERFIIDGRMGRQTPPGFVETVDYQYTKAFRKVQLQSRQTGTGFIYGDDDFSRRSKQVISAMRSRPCGRPQLRIVTQTCPTLVKQLLSNVRKTTPDGEPKEEAADNQPDDGRVCLEYWISRRPTWVAPEVDDVEKVNPAYEAYLEMKRLHAEAKERNNPKTSNRFKIGVP